ncbi:hypothetical protein EYR40_010550 [Pleurotus pulmonarius]|nr:hypothetical protein EYR40_010550 [Pleurotus pulmonarius]
MDYRSVEVEDVLRRYTADEIKSAMTRARAHVAPGAGRQAVHSAVLHMTEELQTKVLSALTTSPVLHKRSFDEFVVDMHVGENAPVARAAEGSVLQWSCTPAAKRSKQSRLDELLRGPYLAPVEEHVIEACTRRYISRTNNEALSKDICCTFRLESP